jgi:hypothetical protein
MENIKEIKIDFENKKIHIEYLHSEEKCILELTKNVEEVLGDLGLEVISMSELRSDINNLFDEMGLESVRC